MKLNTSKTVTVRAGTPEAHYEAVPDVYLMPETVSDARTLDELFRISQGKVFEFAVDKGENPALILRIVEVSQP